MSQTSITLSDTEEITVRSIPDAESEELEGTAQGDVVELVIGCEGCTLSVEAAELLIAALLHAIVEE